MMTITTIIFFFARCSRDHQVTDARGNAYAGADKCLKCHQAISSSYLHTAHFLSTGVANEKSVERSFSKDSNELFVNDSTHINMEKRDSGLYKVLYVNNKQMISQRFDLVMGSVKGQTFLSWYGTGLYQLPVSYISALNRWSSSPGYALADLKFTRSITKDCFECHSSFANRDDHGLSDFRSNPKSWVFNIDCERCHGPAAAHVRFHEDNPKEKKSRSIVAFNALSRQQKIDLCAVCHAGNNNILLKSRFAFRMGDTLTSYMLPISKGNQLDVHGNQTQLLSQSKCFKMSNLDCSTCHIAHVSERGYVQIFNEHCQKCHSPETHFCILATDSNITFIKNNCTGCHMPAQSSKAIRVQATVNSTLAIPTAFVNYRIAIYPEQTEIILQKASYTESRESKPQIKKIDFIQTKK